MSYIRAGSNPEGLYVFSAADDRDGKTKVHLIPGWKYSLKNIGNGEPMCVPQAVFNKGVRLWSNCPDEMAGVKHEGFSIKEVHVFLDDGDPKKYSVVPRKYNACDPEKGGRETEFLVRVAYKRKWMLLWRVTWAYVVHNALSEFRRPKKSKRKKVSVK